MNVVENKGIIGFVVENSDIDWSMVREKTRNLFQKRLILYNIQIYHCYLDR